MRVSDEAKWETRAFAPALNAAVNLLTQAFQRELNQLLDEEAKHLGLAEGWRGDIPKRVWLVKAGD